MTWLGEETANGAAKSSAAITPREPRTQRSSHRCSQSEACVMLPDMAAALQATEDFLVEVGVETQPAEQRCGPTATPRVA